LIEYAELSAEALELVHELEGKLSQLTGEKIVAVVYKEGEDE
jgi:hypothetical protein